MKKEIILIKIMLFSNKTLVEELIIGFHIYIISSFLLNIGISLKYEEMEDYEKHKYIKDEKDKLKNYKIYKIKNAGYSRVIVFPFIFKKLFISCDDDINSRFSFYHELGHIINIIKYIMLKLFISLLLNNKYLFSSAFFLSRFNNISQEIYCDIYATLRMVDFDINKLTIFNCKVNSSNLIEYIFIYAIDSHPINSFRLEIIKDVLNNGDLYCDDFKNYLTKEERKKVLLNNSLKKEKYINLILDELNYW